MCYKKIFDILDPLTTIFQSKDIDLLGAVNSLQVVTNSIKILRSDVAFKNLYYEATTFMNKSEFTFTPLPMQRSRKKKYCQEKQLQTIQLWIQNCCIKSKLTSLL